ncbi:nuclear transport factor 2 family protein [Microbacterium sp. GXF0217]
MTTTNDQQRERNTRTVEAFYQSERDRNIDTWREMWHPEGRQTFPFNAARTVEGIDELVRITARKFDVRPPYEINTTIEPFFDPTRVLARLHLVFRQVVVGEMHIWCIFHFDDDGLIVEVEEMLDTATGLPIPR